MILKDLSILWSLIHTLVLFLLLFESRYSQKKTMVISLTTMIPLIMVNLLLFILLGMNRYGTLMLLTLSVPSFVVFWWLAKHRDGRFFFTFCMVDTVVLEIVYITYILNYYIAPESGWIVFTVRLLIYPLMEFFVYKYLRPMYRKVQAYTQKGWGIFAVIGLLFYLAVTLLMTYPTIITDRPEYLPVLGLMFLLMPVIYVHIIITLRNQQMAYEMEQQDSILKLQVDGLTERLDALSSADERFRIERHDFRHKMQTVAAMVEKEEYSQLRQLALEYSDQVDKKRLERYCDFSVIDAALASYIRKAERWGIPVSTKLAFPETLPVSEAELATVLANALENAIHACEKVEGSETYIQVQAICTPRLMIRISNSCTGKIVFDENNVPVNYEEGHGFGTRSIVAFCEKYGVFYEFKATEDSFSLQLIFGR